MNILFGEPMPEATSKQVDQVEDTLIEMLVSLCSMIETPLVDTVYSHNLRCGEIASILLANIDVRELSEEDRALLQSNPKVIKYMVAACQMHDIGKAQTPSHLLMQPSRLTDAEMNMIKEHTTHPTTMMFDKISRRDNLFVTIVEDCVRYHHETYNGVNGYPEGIVGDNIPLVARVMALIDTLDNLVRKTVYSEPMTFDKAKAIVVSNSGVRFDPKIVNALLKAEESVRTVFDKFQ